jgi:hypothetical protein
MKKIFFLFVFFCFFSANAQIGIGTDTPDASSILDLRPIGNDRGLLIPRLTESQRNSIVSPANGLLIFQTDSIEGFYFFSSANSIWVKLSLVPELLASNTNISSNTSSITTNTSSITSNLNEIQTNTVSITANTASITNNTNAIQSNEVAITTNTQSVTLNTNAIASNAVSITTNINDIAANTASITANLSAGTASITANIVGITSNSVSITTNTSSITNNQNALVSNTASITTNTSSITSNLNEIQTNTVSITANTSSITNSVPYTGATNSIDIGTNSLTIGGNLTGGNSVNSKLSGFVSNVVSYSGNHTLSIADNGKILKFSNTTGVTLTLPDSGIPEGFNCMILQNNTGQITFTGTFFNRNSFTKTAGQYSIVTVMYVGSNFIISGEMSN